MPTQRRTPFRPRKRDEITQTFNDGMVTIYTVTDGAASGYMPEPTLTELVKLPYQERKLGIKRYYSAKQNMIHAERVIRVPRSAAYTINNQQIAKTEDGNKHRIDLVQIVPDVYPPCQDITLVDYAQDEIEPHPVPPIVDPVEGPPVVQPGEGGDADG